MFDFFSFLFGNTLWKLHSRLIRHLLRIRGVRVGKNFYIEGLPKLKIRGSPSNIIIGENVIILGNIDLRNRENGSIHIHDQVTIEGGCRLVSARDGRIEIGTGSILTTGAILNGGADILIGRQCLIGPRVTINANEHLIQKEKSIREQGFLHKPVIIDDDCWTGANVVINKGVHLAQGTVVGAMSVVTKDTEPYGIYAGAPARKISERK